VDPAVPTLAPGLPVVLGVALLGHLVLTEPLLRTRARRALADAVAREDAPAGRRVRRAWRGRTWAAAALALGVGLAGGLSPAQMGLRLSRDGGLGTPADAVALGTPVATAALAAGALVLALGGARLGAVRALGARERARALGRALVDGCAEAVVLTGLCVTVLATLLPAAPAEELALVAGLVAGASRAAQRSAGVVVAGVFGTLAAWVLLDTGSLLFAVVLQVLVHASVLVAPGALVVPADAGGPGRR
jgi:hypothetical protein